MRTLTKVYEKVDPGTQQHDYHVVDVAGDGNCFYRAVLVTLGYSEERYATLKQLLNEYLLSNRQVFNYLPNLESLAKKILKEGEAANYEVIRFTAEFL